MACNLTESSHTKAHSAVGLTDESIREASAINPLCPDEFDFVENPSSELYCAICLSILSNPNLTSCCGSHFCHGCIDRVQAEGKPCPLCQNQDYTIMLDKSVMRRVMQLKAWCPKKEQGCNWVGELSEVEKHLGSKCDFVSVTCSLLCGSEVPRYQIPDHKVNTCPNRPHTCPHCDFQATYAVITEEHLSKCDSYPVECSNGCGVTHVKRKDLPDHLGVCPLEVIKCEFRSAGCEMEVSRKEMPQHLETSISSHVALISVVCSRFEEKLEMKDKMLAEILAEFDQKMKANEKATNDLLASISLQQHEIEQLKTRLQEAERTIRLHSIKVPPVEFVMTDFRSHYFLGDQWFSKPFCTHDEGYKMCLSVFAWGIGQARGTHVSVFANLMRGEFDASLKWPFRGCLEVEIETNDTIYEKTLRFSSWSPPKAANRVQLGERNEYGQGCVRCVPHTKLSALPATLKLRVCSVTLNV